MNKILALAAFVVFLVIAAGLLWLAIQTDNTVSTLLSFAAGLSMIFLPCTLPLAFVIVPIAAREKNAGRAIGLAIAFAIGLAVTLTIYGVITAIVGDYLGLDKFTRVMFVVAGAAALIFGLTELGLLRLPLPVFTHHIPNWISEGYLKTFFLGLFLGNAGIGCPNPAFYVLLTYIASTGSLASGAGLGLVHGLGRATPLIFLVLLTVLGMRTFDWVGRVSTRINTVMGFALIIVGAFILTYGLFGMTWWEDSYFHFYWNEAVLAVAPNLAEAPDHDVVEGMVGESFWGGWLALLVFILAPILWYKLKKNV